MNLLAGGTLLSTYARMRSPANPYAREFVSRFVRVAPALVAATVTFGVAPLLFLQVLYGRVFFVSSILMAWLWLGVVPLVLLLYAGAYALSLRHDRATPRWLHAAAAVLLIAVSLLYTANMTLMLRADQFGSLYAASGRGWHLNAGDPTFWPRWLHTLLGAVAVSGLATATFGLARRAARPEFARWAVRYGAGAAAWATAFNAVTGAWWAGALPAWSLERLTGATPAAAVLAAGIVVGLATLALLVTLARGTASLALALAAIGAMLLTIVAMILTRDTVRTAALEHAGFAQTTWVAPQWGPILIFFVLLVVSLATVAWLAHALWRAWAPQAAGETRTV
jgi:hypothetical protein